MKEQYAEKKIVELFLLQFEVRSFKKDVKKEMEDLGHKEIVFGGSVRPKLFSC